MAWTCAYCDEVNLDDNSSKCIVCGIQKTVASAVAIDSTVTVVEVSVLIAKKKYVEGLRGSIKECKSQRVIYGIAIIIFLFLLLLDVYTIITKYSLIGKLGIIVLGSLLVFISVWLAVFMQKYGRLDNNVTHYTDAIADLHMIMLSDNHEQIIKYIYDRKKNTKDTIKYPSNKVNTGIWSSLTEYIKNKFPPDKG